MLLRISIEAHAGKKKNVLASDQAGNRKGRTAHITDAVSLANKVWDCVQEKQVPKCWLKLPLLLLVQLKNAIIVLLFVLNYRKCIVYAS